MEMTDVSKDTATGYQAAPPPELEPGEERSPWGDFAPSAERQVLLGLLQDLAADGGPLDVLDSERDAATQRGLSESTAQTVRQAVVDDPDMNGENASDVLGGLVEYLYYARRSPLLAKYRLLHPAYRTYDDHYANAEVPSGTVPASVPTWIGGSRWPLLGRRIGFPIGVGASGLTTNARCVQRLFQAGYSVVTYKTVRSQVTKPQPRPNWALLDSSEIKDIRNPDLAIVVRNGTAFTSADSSANSFGVPSPEPTQWTSDFAAAADAVRDGQVLICSVLGEDYNEDLSARSVGGLIADFVLVTRQAIAAGAEFVELNLSCPNTIGTDGRVAQPLCSDVDLAIAIVRDVRKAVGSSAKLGAKLSYLSRTDLVRILDGVATQVDFVSGINTVGRPVVSENEATTWYFGERDVAGVGGTAILPLAIEFVATCAAYRNEHASKFAIIGIGGVTDPASFAQMHDAGADVVQSVTGVFLNTLLAVDCMRALGGTMRSPLDDALKASFLRAASATMPTPAWKFSATSGLPPVITLELLDELVNSGELSVQPSSGSPRYLRKTSATRHHAHS